MFGLSKSKERIIFRVMYTFFTLLFIATWFFDIHTKKHVIAPIFALILSTIGLFGILLLFIPLAYIAYRYFREDGEAYKIRVLENRPELSPKLLEWEEEILSLGFEHFAIAEGYNPANAKTVNTLFYYLDKSKTLLAIIAISPKMQFVVFSSNFVGGFEQETLYNYKNWTNMDSDEGFMVAIATSISLAYDYHLHQLERLKAIHGEPIFIESIESSFSKPEQQKRQLKAIHRTNIQHILELYRFVGAWLIGGLVSLQVYEIYGSLGGLTALFSIAFLPQVLFDSDKTTNRMKPIDAREKSKVAE